MDAGKRAYGEESRTKGPVSGSSTIRQPAGVATDRPASSRCFGLFCTSDRATSACWVESPAPPPVPGPRRASRCHESGIVLRYGPANRKRERAQDVAIAWAYLIAAGLCEIGWPIGLKWTQDPGWTVLGTAACCFWRSGTSRSAPPTRCGPASAPPEPSSWAFIAGHSASKTRVNALMTRQSIRLAKVLAKMDGPPEIGSPRFRALLSAQVG
jgi:hypothetical protein